MIVEKQMECRLAGETEVLGENPAPAPLLSITKSTRAAAVGNRHKSLPLIPILSQINPDYTISSYVSKIHFDI
jgi:hypothetical protein